LQSCAARKPGEAELVAIGVDQMEEALTPFSIAGTVDG